MEWNQNLQINNSLSQGRKYAFSYALCQKLCILYEFIWFQPIVAFHIETSHLFCSAKQMPGFYIEHNKCNSCLKFYETYHAELISSFLFYFFFLFVAMGNDHLQTIAVKSDCLGVIPSTFRILDKLACLFHIPLFNWVKFVLKDLLLFRKGLLCSGLIAVSFFWLI